MLDFILDLLSTPAILIGLFTLVGLILMKAPTSKKIEGTIKATMGFLILGAGAGVIVGSLDSVNLLFEAVFKVEGVIPTNEAVVSLALVDFGVLTTWVMIGGMVMNLLFARFTPFKYIFLTGHHTLFMAALIVSIFSVSKVSDLITIVVGSIILGALMVLMPAMIQPFTKKITGNDDIAVGHFGSFGYLGASIIGKFLGNPKKSTEDVKVPKSLNFLRDSMIAIGITMITLFIVLCLLAGPKMVTDEIAKTNWLVWSIVQGLTFAGGVWIVLQGVKMIITEIVPAFKGISDKLIPGAKPALDCPIVFPFAPNAVLIGFFSSFAAGLIMMFILPVASLVVIIPGLVPHFFTGATAGVYGNATGGRRGAILGGFINGIIISVLPAILYITMETLGFKGTTFGDADFAVVGIILDGILKLFGLGS